MPTNNSPIACTLGGDDYAERLAWIANLNQDGLVSHERRETALELRYAASVRKRVHELVRKESECCAFLTFTLDESSHDVCLTITVPDRARDAAELFFEPFLTSEAPPATAAHCARPANGCCS
jgi:hypothetical protein